MEPNVLEVEVRRRIFHIVQEYPGLHIREIQRHAQVEYPLCDYHLRQLEKHRLVTSLEEGGYKRYFPAAGFAERPLTENEKRIVASLRRKVPLRVVLTLLDGPVRHAELASKIGVSKSTTSYHLRQLETVGIVSLDPVTKGYRLVDPAAIGLLLHSVKPHRSGLDAFADAWLDLYRKGPEPGRHP